MLLLMSKKFSDNFAAMNVELNKDTSATGNVVAVSSNCLMFSKIRQKRNRQLDASDSKFVFISILSFFKKELTGQQNFGASEFRRRPVTSVETSL